MDKELTASNLISINFRFAPEEVRQLMLLGTVYGNRTRAVSAAIARLYQQTLAENAGFRELVAEGGSEEPAADDVEG